MPIGWPELIIILVIVLLVFGPKRLPMLGRQLGGGMREFKDSITNKTPPADAEDPAAARPALTQPEATDPPAGDREATRAERDPSV